MNNPITLIPPLQSLNYVFVAADSICVALQISQQYSPKARMPTHWMPSPNQILTQNDHSRSLKVIRFSVNKEPLGATQYNIIIMALNVKVRKIQRAKKSKNRHLRRPHSHLTPSLQQTPANIQINLTLLETRIHGLHCCR